MKPPQHRQRAASPAGARGLTLIECMVAIGILALLMSLAVPSFGHIMARHRLKAAAEGLAMDLSEMRFEAARRGQVLHLHVDTGPAWCYALSAAAGCDCRGAQSCQLKTVTAIDHPAVELVEGQDLQFDPRQAAGTRSGSATLRGADGARLRVALSPLGRPTVCAPQRAVPGYPAC